MTETPAEQIFRGTGVSGYPVAGVLHVLADSAHSIDPSQIDRTTRTGLDAALREASKQLEVLIGQQDEMAAGILEFQQVLLEDEDLLHPIYATIDAGQPAAAAWADGINTEIKQYQESNDPQLISRADDLADLRERVLLTLAGSHLETTAIPKGSILIAKTMSPSYFLSLDFSQISGIALLEGSPTSHVALLARARNISMLIGVDAPLAAFSSGSNAILDTEDGCLIIAPDDQHLLHFRKQQLITDKLKTKAQNAAKKPARLQNGEQVRLYVNIDHPDILDDFSAEICDGVGLTRTEFLFENASQPDEEQQYLFYRRLIEWADGRPVTIRTLDAGGDKPIAGITETGESNPFLGLRGVRLSLENQALLIQQLRAIARAAVEGKVKVMVPMVTVPEELTQVKALLDQAIKQLENEGIACAKPQLGIMVEVPAAALCADQFDADFYSIGSNDLLQYVTATARDNTKVSYLADPNSPALIKLIEMTVDVAHIRGKEVSLCGDMASTPHYLDVLMKTGLRSLSCAPAQVGYVKMALSEIQPPNKARMQYV